MITEIKNLRCTDLLQLSIKQEPRRFRNNRSWFSLSDYQKVVNMCLCICMLQRIRLLCWQKMCITTDEV